MSTTTTAIARTAIAPRTVLAPHAREPRLSGGWLAALCVAAGLFALLVLQAHGPDIHRDVLPGTVNGYSGAAVGVTVVHDDGGAQGVG